MTQTELFELIKRYQENKCTPEEEKVFEEFFHSYQIGQEQWDDKLHGSQQEIENRIYSKILEKTRFKEERSIPTFHWWYKAAAAILILFSLSYLFTNVQKEVPVKETPEPLVVKTIQRGQKSMLHLVDGTVVYINSDSKISYPKKFATDKREIYLDGEAFFEVSHDSERPFIVHTGTLDIKVLGTSFNVNTFENRITVTLASGKVHIQNMNPSINYSSLGILKPNQQFVFDKVDHSIKVNEVNVMPYIAWTKKQLIFYEEPISSVVKKLEKWYDVEFQFETAEIKNCIFTGTFDNEPLKLVLESLKNVADINYKIEGKRIKLSGTGCDKKKTKSDN